MNSFLIILILTFTPRGITLTDTEEFCEITTCEMIESLKTEINEQFIIFNNSFNNKNYELIKLERRVRSLEQPYWQLSSSPERWLDCVKGPCKCRPETKSLTCWNTGILALPMEQVLPEDTISIDLGINLLTTLNKKTFWGLKKISEIDLFDNRIDYLPENIFDKLINLQYLRLHKNLLEEMDNDIFAFQKRLRTLDLSNNKLRVLPSGLFRTCVNLIVLHLSSNNLKEIPAELFNNLVLLEDLDLNGNHLNQLNSLLFKDLINLRRLKLAENNIARLNSDIFDHLINLEYLTLRKNDLTKISPRTFSNLFNLTILDFSANKIMQIGPGSFKLNELKELHLQQNFMYGLSEDIFNETSNLEKLLLYSNNLEELKERTFNGLVNLKTLLINNNLLTTFHPAIFQYVPNLQKLHLDSNKFLFLPPKSLDALKQLIFIKLTKNPWHCDCNMLYLSEWVLLNSIKLWDSQPTCKGPGQLGGADLKDMNFDKLCHGQWASMVNLAARIPVRQPSFTPPY